MRPRDSLDAVVRDARGTVTGGDALLALFPAIGAGIWIAARIGRSRGEPRRRFCARAPDACIRAFVPMSPSRPRPRPRPRPTCRDGFGRFIPPPGMGIPRSTFTCSRGSVRPRRRRSNVVRGRSPISSARERYSSPAEALDRMSPTPRTSFNSRATSPTPYPGTPYPGTPSPGIPRMATRGVPGTDPGLCSATDSAPRSRTRSRAPPPPAAIRPRTCSSADASRRLAIRTCLVCVSRGRLSQDGSRSTSPLANGATRISLERLVSSCRPRAPRAQARFPGRFAGRDAGRDARGRAVRRVVSVGSGRGPRTSRVSASRDRGFAGRGRERRRVRRMARGVGGTRGRGIRRDARARREASPRGGRGGWLGARGRARGASVGTTRRGTIVVGGRGVRLRGSREIDATRRRERETRGACSVRVRWYVTHGRRA